MYGRYYYQWKCWGTSCERRKDLRIIDEVWKAFIRSSSGSINNKHLRDGMVPVYTLTRLQIHITDTYVYANVCNKLPPGGIYLKVKEIQLRSGVGGDMKHRKARTAERDCWWYSGPARHIRIIIRLLVVSTLRPANWQAFPPENLFLKGFPSLCVYVCVQKRRHWGSVDRARQVSNQT